MTKLGLFLTIAT